jgi:hypothetical protein
MSMVYDVIFMVQHYCLYSGSAEGRGTTYAAVADEAGDALDSDDAYEFATDTRSLPPGSRRT